MLELYFLTLPTKISFQIAIEVLVGKVRKVASGHQISNQLLDMMVPHLCLKCKSQGDRIRFDTRP